MLLKDKTFKILILNNKQLNSFKTLNLQLLFQFSKILINKLILMMLNQLLAKTNQIVTKMELIFAKLQLLFLTVNHLRLIPSFIK